MQKGIISEEMLLFEKNVELRFNLIKKQIERYCQDLERATKAKKPLPIPKSAENEDK